MRATVAEQIEYQDDLYAWTQEQAGLLRARRADGIDWDNLAEEIESLGARDRRELQSRLRVILTHLLTWQGQPGRRGPNWRRTLRTQRLEIGILLKQSPSLRRHVDELMTEIYERAAEEAAEETPLPRPTFPSACPYDAEQVLERGWLPPRGFVHG